MPKAATVQHVGPESKAELTPYSSPRQRFHGDTKVISDHQELIDEPAFDRGADASLVEFMTNLAETVIDLNTAASAGYQLRGAVRYLRQFKTLAETPKAAEKTQDMSALRPTDPIRRP